LDAAREGLPKRANRTRPPQSRLFLKIHKQSRQPFRTSGNKSGHSDEVKSRDQTTSEPAWANAMPTPTPKKIVLPIIAPKILLPKVFMSLSINLMIGE
jgi:hypothetical protein